METETYGRESENGKKGHGRARKTEAAREPGEQEAGGRAAEQLGERERHLKEEVEQAGEKASSLLHKWPAATVAVCAGLGLAAASMIGVGEIAIAGAAGYLAYRWLGKNRRQNPEQPGPGMEPGMEPGMGPERKEK